METFGDFKAFNRYLGVAQPLNSMIDVGVYEPSTRRQSAAIDIDFYRISLKSQLVFPELTGTDAPVSAVFFNSPGTIEPWDIPTEFAGYYLQLSKALIRENRYLFQNYLEYGQHQPLFLTLEEERDLLAHFENLLHYYTADSSQKVLMAYCHLIMSLVETYYHRQFMTDAKKYHPVVIGFQERLHLYYEQEPDSMPTVRYFAEQMHLSPNYLGDLIKAHTGKSAIQTIHEFIVERAKQLLNQGNLNSSQVAYALGFDYPSYFNQLFKKTTQLTPKQYQEKALTAHR